MSNSNSSADRIEGKLIATAITAAAAGAALAYAVIKKSQPSEFDKSRGSFAKSQSFIFDDPSNCKETLPAQGRSDNILFPHNHEEKMKRRIATRVGVEQENNTPRNSVTVKVPATSANMGPGCKCV